MWNDAYITDKKLCYINPVLSIILILAVPLFLDLGAPVYGSESDVM